MDLGNLVIAGVAFGNVIALKEGKLEPWWIVRAFVFALILYSSAIFVVRRSH